MRSRGDAAPADNVSGAGLRASGLESGQQVDRLSQGSEPKYTAYSMNRLAIVPAAGGNPKILTEKLDRGVSAPALFAGKESLIFLVADDHSEYPAQVAVSGGAVERLLRQR